MKATVAALLVFLSACGGNGADGPAVTGSARSGEELFNERILGPNPGCITCHSLDPDTTLVGPSIAGVAVRAETREPGISAADSLLKSIAAPSAFVVDGFDDGKMPSDWEDELDPAEIDALVSYLLTLR